MAVRTLGKKYEYIVAIAMAVWGAFLLLPLETFVSSPTFSAMRAIMPETIWGICALIAGLSYLIIMHKNWIRVRQASAIISSFCWLTLSVVYFAGNPASTGWFMYAVLSAIQINNYYEIVLWRRLNGRT